jgi:hypothetical protein
MADPGCHGLWSLVGKPVRQFGCISVVVRKAEFK